MARLEGHAVNDSSPVTPGGGSVNAGARFTSSGKSHPPAVSGSRPLPESHRNVDGCESLGAWDPPPHSLAKAGGCCLGLLCRQADTG